MESSVDRWLNADPVPDHRCRFRNVLHLERESVRVEFLRGIPTRIAAREIAELIHLSRPNTHLRVSLLVVIVYSLKSHKGIPWTYSSWNLLVGLT